MTKRVLGDVRDIVLGDLKPNEKYAFFVSAVNEVGESRLSDIITFKTLPTSPEGPPLNVSVRARDSETLEVS